MSDHELLIGSTTYRLNLVRDDTGRAMYSVVEDIPEYSPQLIFEQTNWINGHGQYLFEDTDSFFEGQSIDTTQDGRIILGPLINEVKGVAGAELDTAPVCFFWSAINSKWLCATTGKVYVYSTVWTEVTTAGISSVTNFAEFNGYVFAARGATQPYVYSADGLTWTTCTLTDHHANRFFTAPNAAGTANVLWKSGTSAVTNIQINELKSHTTGINGAEEWSTAAYIGDTSNDITNLFLVNDNLMVGREDNLYNYDSAGGIHPLMDDLKTAVSARNFQYVTTWQAATYFSRGNSLGEITSYNTFDTMGPLENTIDIGKVGYCCGLTADTNYLYAALDEGTNIHIYKGREARTAQGLTWQWCPLVFVGTNACTTIAFCQHSATDRRLWFGYGTHTAYAIITDNPTADSAARFCASGWLRMSYTFGHNLYWDKLFNRLITETKGCTSAIKVSTKYRKNTDTTATSLTTDITTNGVVETDFTSLVACKKIQFEVWLATGTNTITPEVLMFKATGIEKPESVRVHECVYAIGDKPTNRAETLRTALRTARTSVALIRLADLRYGEYIAGTTGTDYAYVICQPGYPMEVEVEHEKGRAPELGIRVRWQEVGNTIVDDFGYYYSAIEDIFQDIHDSTNHALGLSFV